MMKYPRYPNEEVKRGKVSLETLKRRKEYWHSINGEDVFPPQDEDSFVVKVETKKEYNSRSKTEDPELEIAIHPNSVMAKVARKTPLDFYETFGWLKKYGETFSFVEWKDGTAYWYPTIGLKIFNWK